MKRLNIILFVLLTAALAQSCGHKNDYMPKPQAYLRLDTPDKDYRVLDTTPLPFTFEVAKEAQVLIKRDNSKEKYIDLYYPRYHATAFLTYKSIHGSAEWRAQVDTSYKFLSPHFDHSSGVDEKQYSDPQHQVLAYTYILKGQKVASTYQFWVSDSSRHFVRGALFLDQTPNNDSLAPVLDYLQQDLRHLVETIRWRE